MPFRDETEKIEQEAATGRAEGFRQCGFWFYWRQVSETESNILQSGKNKEAETGKRDGAVAVHKAVVPDLHEACGQHMLEKSPDELDDIEGDFSTAIAVFLSI